MKPLAVILFFLSLSTTSISQIIELDIHKYKLNDFIRFENKAGWVKQPNKSTHLLPKGIAQPVTFIHKEKNLPDLVIKYFYYSKDSTINNILYEWDEDNISTQIGQSKTSAQIGYFIEKYKKLLTYITSQYGPSESTGSLEDLYKIETGDFLKKDIWYPNDSTEIEMYMGLSNFYEKTGHSTIPRYYRIRLYVKDIKPRSTVSPMAKPDNATVAIMDSTAMAFFADLASADYGNAKLHLSDLITLTTTSTKLSSFANQLDFTQGFTLYMVGAQTTPDGNSYPMLQYRYSSDTESPPGFLIKVYFDDKLKIVGMKPVQKL